MPVFMLQECTLTRQVSASISFSCWFIIYTGLPHVFRRLILCLSFARHSNGAWYEIYHALSERTLYIQLGTFRPNASKTTRQANLLDLPSDDLASTGAF